MPNNDQYRIADLRSRFASFKNEWSGIRVCCDEKYMRMDHDFLKNNPHKSRFNVPHVASKFVDFLMGKDSQFARWAVEVVDAFGIEAFPYYMSELPTIHTVGEKRGASRQQLLTGVDDEIQAGLRVILWLASTVEPQHVLHDDAEWYHRANLFVSVQAWASHFVIIEGLNATACPDVLRWVDKALEELSKPGTLQLRDSENYLIATQILAELPADRFKNYREFKKFVDTHPEIKTFNKGQKLFIHVGNLYKALAENSRNSAKAVDDFQQRKEKAQKQKKQDRS